jgi:hypothetical protein
VPARPRRRPLVAGSLLGALCAGTLVGPLPSAAADHGELPQRGAGTLSAAIAAGETDLLELPRGIVRRGRPGDVPLRTSSAGPAPRGNLTTAAVSTFNVTYVDDGAVWTAAAKAAFESAVAVWERTIESAVPIAITATATTFGDPSILGGAGPSEFLRNRQGTSNLSDDVFEPIALSNARVGGDQLPDVPDIEADFNPGLAGLYFGTDGNPPADQVDFRTVVLHEIGHGLGMVGSAYVDNEFTAIGDTAGGVRTGVSYDTFTYATTAAQAGSGGKRILSMPDDSAELRTALTGESLYWAGELGRLAAGGRNLRLYAPQQFVEGTSYGHLDESTFPGEHVDGLMTPFIEPGEAFHDVGQIAMGMLGDMGFPVPALRGAKYTALDPVRLLDTREGLGAPKAVVGAGGVVDLPVAGRHGVPLDATAVVLNVTGVAPSSGTDLRAYPTPVVLSPVPVVSNLNLDRGITRANLVTVPVGSAGRVRLRNNSGSVHLLADLAGFYSPGAAAAFTAADPVRILDTRSALGTPGTARLGAGEVLDLSVTGGSSPVPAGASAVALTVTAVSATSPTDVRVYPAPLGIAAPPLVSNINVRPGSAVPNVVIVKVGARGQVRLRNEAGGVHLLADVAGWYDTSSSGTLFRPVPPTRILDTRTRLGTSSTASTTVGAGQAVPVRVGGIARVPSLAQSVVLNVTGVGATATTDVRVYPALATTPPEVSNLNLGRGQTAADLVMVKLGSRSVRLRNAAGEVSLIADVSGWFGPPS